ncbi:GntR family transcriptional regulator [Chromohalobacter israelensis]|uniref:Transcriptional regulator, GntR family n=1 Tax=Chromohalobacter israelensis (strain ATCC BAA-138 / DSM 3043 / CIP 106854 / NCIMB 13768 / 1H11) TaxID=290398 RepID=Q1QWR3_CHRI1|nr:MULTISPECIES: FCD domain-containing protein [Chromohalobacter]ABE59095.1 transcriptional regulator, GntR family [Chromohalobacter salexigens DSM 3043]MDF9435214.1 FCD domain-containing protein [Chromohalobacter israelensis]MDO0946767.1 FCD domain-containing protein [Chromohalobacter salexigens]
MRDKPESATAASTVFESLRRDLINGRFAAGEKLAINTLKAHYRVGLSPLREALNRLAAYGLLQQENQRGFRVPGVSRAELDDIAGMRRELEGMALTRAMQHGDAQWESELLAAAHRLKRADEQPTPLEEWELLHTRFHRTLVAPCGSPWLLRFIEQLHDQFDRYRRMAPAVPGVRAELDAQHQELVSLALARDIEGARALLQSHIRISHDVALGAVPDA